MMGRWKRILAGLVASAVFTMAVSTSVSAVEYQSIDTRTSPSKTTEEVEQKKAKALEMKVESNTWANWPEGPKTYGEGNIVMDADTGAILYAKNIDGKAYPASITKVLTVLVALNNGKMDDKVKITRDSISFLQYGDAHVGLRPDEEITLKDALYAILLASANEASHAVAESLGEGYDWFIQQMNETAKGLGAQNSNFVNTNGLQDPEHYTTARDLALVTRELLNKYPEFQEICQTRQYTIPPTNLEEESRTFQQKHAMFWPKNDHYDERVVAGKTGYTDDALNTLITCAATEDLRVIIVNLKTHGANVYNDTENLLAYAFDNFEHVKVTDSLVERDQESISSIEEGVTLTVPKGVTLDQLTVEYTVGEETLSEGKANFYYNEVPIGSAGVTLTKEFLKENTETDVFKEYSDTQKAIEKAEKKAVRDEKIQQKKEALKRLFAKVAKVGIVLMVLIVVWLVFAAYVRRKKRIARKKKLRQQKLQEQRRQKELQMRNRRRERAQNTRKDDNLE